MSEAQGVLEWDLADRMRKALRVSGRSVQEMSDYLGVAPTTVSTWINGRNRPSPATVRLWAMRCEVPYEWLLGEGVRTAPIRSADRCCAWCGSPMRRIRLIVGWGWQCTRCPHWLPESQVNLYRSLLGLAA